MSVSTISAFQTAVNGLSPASKNVYQLTYLPQNPNGSYNCTLLKNSVAMFKTFVYNAAQSSEANNDANPGGFSVSYLTLDGVFGTSDAQQFLNTLT